MLSSIMLVEAEIPVIKYDSAVQCETLIFQMVQLYAGLVNNNIFLLCSKN
jgi:hypothetical protein